MLVPVGTGLVVVAGAANEGRAGLVERREDVRSRSLLLIRAPHIAVFSNQVRTSRSAQKFCVHAHDALT